MLGLEAIFHFPFRKLPKNLQHLNVKHFEAPTRMNLLECFLHCNCWPESAGRSCSLALFLFTISSELVYLTAYVTAHILALWKNALPSYNINLERHFTN
jgi:hypothetical protein